MAKEDMFSSGAAWSSYEALEQDLMHIVEFIPLEFKQYTVVSYRLLNVILATCSQVDSVFRALIRNGYAGDYPDRARLTEIIRLAQGRGRRRLDILDYAEVFEPVYGLSQKEVEIVRNGDRLAPFGSFSSAQRNERSPRWWAAHNRLKHDYYENHKEATLLNALNTLSALFLLNCIVPSARPKLCERGALTSPNFVEKLFLLDYIDKNPSLPRYSFVIRSALFEHKLAWDASTLGVMVMSSIQAGGW